MSDRGRHLNCVMQHDSKLAFEEYRVANRSVPYCCKDRATSTEGFTVAGMLMFGKTNSITDPECCQEFFPDYREHLSDDLQVRWTNRILEGNINGTTETSSVTTETPADTTETTTKTSSVTTETSADTTETILKIISKNPKVTAKEIASVCGITEDGVAYHIKKLKQSGRIIRIGGSRNGGEWKVVE